jgi:hypothetical protein
LPIKTSISGKRFFVKYRHVCEIQADYTTGRDEVPIAQTKRGRAALISLSPPFLILFVSLRRKVFFIFLEIDTRLVIEGSQKFKKNTKKLITKTAAKKQFFT